MTISGTPDAIIQCVKQICVVMLEVQSVHKSRAPRQPAPHSVPAGASERRRPRGPEASCGQGRVRAGLRDGLSESCAGVQAPANSGGSVVFTGDLGGERRTWGA